MLTNEMKELLKKIADLAHQASEEVYDDDNENGTAGILNLCDKLYEKIDEYLGDEANDVLCDELQEDKQIDMIVKAIWEFDVDNSEMDEKCVDIKGLCKDLAKRELEYCLKHKQLNADDFQYECYPKLPSDWD